MILAVDACYQENQARVAGVLFADWRSSAPLNVCHSRVDGVGGYVPGEFYKRELPGIISLMGEHRLSPSTIVIDGYVYLDGVSKPGLGKHLFDELNGRVSVVGVAKNALAGISRRYAIFRGGSLRPLYVTAEGVALEQAKACITGMHGNHRIPTLLKQVDQACRQQCDAIACQHTSLP